MSTHYSTQHRTSGSMIVHLVWLGLLVFICVNLDYVEGARLMRQAEENCTRGRCDDGRCPDAENEKCPEDGCGPEEMRCGDTLTCVLKGERCPQWPCKLYEKLCADGTCVTSEESNDTCTDGSIPCAYNEKHCESGECRYNWLRCSEDPCDIQRPYKCGTDCFPMTVVCDGFEHCDSGDDEIGCDEGGPSKLWFLMFLLIIPLLCGICYYFYERGDKINREKDTKQNAEDVPMAPQAQQGTDEI